MKLERITNQKIQKLSKTHVYIVKYRHLNTWDTHVPMGTKGLIVLSNGAVCGKKKRRLIKYQEATRIELHQ